MNREGAFVWESEDDACEFAHNWDGDVTLVPPFSVIVDKSYTKAMEMLISKGFDVNHRFLCGWRSTNGVYPMDAIYHNVLEMSTNTFNNCSVEIRRMLYNQRGALITETLFNHQQHGETYFPKTSRIRSLQTTYLLLEAGAKWPYDIRPEGCTALRKINSAKGRAVAMLHVLKGVIPKDLINEIVMEIYDNRMK